MIVNLKTNDMAEPIGIGGNPRFSWQMVSDVAGQQQTAYRLTICKGNEEIWTTGRAEGGASVGIPYAGPALAGCTKYSWEVQVWDKEGAVHTARASFETGPDTWEGSEWISMTGAKTGGSSVFRRAFSPGKTVKSARLYATGLGVFDVWINGVRVGNDVLKPGFTMMTKRVHSFAYDVTGLLETGKNAVSCVITAGWWADEASPGNPGKDTAVRMKLVLFYQDGSSGVISTGTDWKTADASPIRMAGIWKGETYDANYGTAWMLPGFNDAHWKAAIVNKEFTGEITPMVGEPIRVREDLERRAKSVTVYSGAKGASLTQHGKINVTGKYKDGQAFSLRPGETAVVDLGQNFSGWSYFEAEAPKGTVITVKHGEMLNDRDGLKSRGNDGPEGSLYTENLRKAKATAIYTTSGKGIEKYHSTHTFYGFRYCAVIVTQPVIFHEVKGMVVTSALTDTIRLKTSDESVNQLVSNIFWGMYSNYLSIPTDCPQRDERQGWTADTQVFSTTGAYSADVKGFFEKWMADMRDSQRADGAFPDCAPTGYGGYANLGWGDAGVIVPYNMYRMYGDAAFIEDNWDAMVKFMDAYMAGTENWGGGRAYGDWLAYESNDKDIKSICGVAYYAMDARLMSEMARVTGREKEAAKYRKVHEAEKAFFQQQFVKKDGSLTRTEQTACLMALWADLLPSEASKQKVVDTLLENIARNGNKLQTGFLGTAILLPLLTEAGASNVAYRLLLQRGDPSWLYSVDQGATTVWERWNSFTLEKGFGPVGMNSFNHYAYGAVAEWMYGYMAGIMVDFEQPGFKHIILRPYPNKAMRAVDCAFDSPYGTIVSKWEYSGDNFVYDITAPANTTATVYLPAPEGMPCAMQGSGIEHVGREGGREVFHVGTGTYRFVVGEAANHVAPPSTGRLLLSVLAAGAGMAAAVGTMAATLRGKKRRRR